MDRPRKKKKSQKLGILKVENLIRRKFAMFSFSSKEKLQEKWYSSLNVRYLCSECLQNFKINISWGG